MRSFNGIKRKKINLDPIPRKKVIIEHTKPRGFQLVVYGDVVAKGSFAEMNQLSNKY